MRKRASPFQSAEDTVQDIMRRGTMLPRLHMSIRRHPRYTDTLTWVHGTILTVAITIHTDIAGLTIVTAIVTGVTTAFAETASEGVNVLLDLPGAGLDFDRLLFGASSKKNSELCHAIGSEESMHPKTDGILESSLYVDDVARSQRFYEEIFGFTLIADFAGRGCAMQAGPRHVLLLFKKGGSVSIESPHDGDGELHIAFAIASAELSNWESWLQSKGIPIEEKRSWESGGTSLYFRDRDRHLLEVATPGTWPIY